jgi:NADPH-dependent 2,4-dienoyl-CoA reductase/sulfur reductase-like enzyme/nitrite reductase/ring-hydroxylating ferredoxin subunit
MNEQSTPPGGPNLREGVAFDALADGAMLVGHVGEDPVLLARCGADVFAIDALCTHYGASLAEGLLVGETVRCPWHHACFSLGTGEAIRAPALNPVSRWRVERRDGLVRVLERLEKPARPARDMAGEPRSVMIVGGGAAGNAAAEMLRRQGYAGALTMISADDSGPCDRPALSKGFLAGAAPEDWIFLRAPDFYKEHDIELKLNAPVVGIDASAREIRLMDGSRYSYDALLLATGAEPVRLDVPGGDLPHVRYLRTVRDCRALVARARESARAVVIGSSFIGLEAAASLRARGVEVDVVAPEAIPMKKILGDEVGQFLRELHESHGVRFHLGQTVASINEQNVVLANGDRLSADLVVVGIGVRPATALAEQAGLAIDRGVAVDEFLETSVPGVYAAGDIARWPDPLTGERIRVEHWVVAERQGQTAARNILGAREIFDAVPFFWTEQYDLAIAYVGRAEGWDSCEIDGRLEARDCAIAYRRDGKTLAVATIYRDLESLRAELAFERAIAAR